MTKDSKKNRPFETIWILDGSLAEASQVGKALRSEYNLQVFVSFAELEKALQQEQKKKDGNAPGLLISELSFPDGKLLERLQSGMTPLPPVMIVSSENTRSVIEECLRHQVEDYFLKPVDSNLLSSKVRRFFDQQEGLRKKASIGLQLDRFSLEVQTKKNTVVLTHKEFQILSLLYHAYPGEVRRSQIVQEIWKNVSVVSRTFDVHLFHVRQKLETLGYGIRYEGVGYCLIPPKD